MVQQNRYERHQLIDWWEQDKLSCARVLVVGAGALGNEVLKNLALIGVGNITIIDFDTVSLSNLTRSVLFRESDVGLPKVEVARARILEINPEISVEIIDGDLEFDLGVGTIREHDLIIGCLDSINARYWINHLAYRAGVPWINGGIGVAEGEISFFDPNTDAACYECTITDQMWERRNQRYSCQGLKREIPELAVPTTAPIASMVAAMEVQQALLYLHGQTGLLEAGEKNFLSLNPWKTFKVQIQHQEDCLAHDLTIAPTITIQYQQDMKVQEVFKRLELAGFSQSVLWLRNEIIGSLRCLNCHAQERINLPRQKYLESDLACPNCQSERDFDVLKHLSDEDRAHRYADLSEIAISELCLPSNEILHCQTLQGNIAIQFYSSENQ